MNKTVMKRSHYYQIMILHITSHTHNTPHCIKKAWTQYMYIIHTYVWPHVLTRYKNNCVSLCVFGSCPEAMSSSTWSQCVFTRATEKQESLFPFPHTKRVQKWLQIRQKLNILCNFVPGLNNCVQYYAEFLTGVKHHCEVKYLMCSCLIMCSIRRCFSKREMNHFIITICVG